MKNFDLDNLTIEEAQIMIAKLIQRGLKDHIYVLIINKIGDEGVALDSNLGRDSAIKFVRVVGELPSLQ